MLKNDWPVLPDLSGRQNGDRKCFYCNAAVGDQHLVGCVTRTRTVVVRTIVTHVISVPEDWDQSVIEFTEGSSCSDNIIAALHATMEALNAVGRCMCGMVEREYVREADEEDEAELMAP